MNALLTLSRVLGRITLAIAGIALLAIMLVTVLDVILRCLFNLTRGASEWTLGGSMEMVKYLLLVMLLSAMAAHVERSQVVVEVFTQKLGATTCARIAGFCLLLFAVVGIVLMSGLVEAAASAAEFGEMTQDLAVPMAPIYLFAAVLFVIFSLRSGIHGLEGLIKGVSHDI